MLDPIKNILSIATGGSITKRTVFEECMRIMDQTPVNGLHRRQQNIEKRSPKLKKRVAEFEKLLDKGYSIDQMAEEMNLKPQKVAFFLSIMGLLEGYKYQEGEINE